MSEERTNCLEPSGSELSAEYLQIAAQQEIETAARALKSAESLLKDAGRLEKGIRARLRFWRNSLRGEIRTLESSLTNTQGDSQSPDQ